MPPRHVRTLRQPFVGQESKWDSNRGPVAVTAAIIKRPDGEPLTGVRIRQQSSGAFLVILDDHALALADRIVDVIEARAASAGEDAG